MTAALEMPRTLSPSKMSLWEQCQLKFRYRYVDGIADVTGLAAEVGTVAHAALEYLIGYDPEDRADKKLRRAALDRAFADWLAHPDHEQMGHLDDAEVLDGATAAFRRYFSIEDPSSVVAEALELDFTVEFEGIVLRGVIDRLDVRPDGSLVVVDYKSGSMPLERYQGGRLRGVKFYATMIELDRGVTPVEVQLTYLGQSSGVVAVPVAPNTVSTMKRRIVATWESMGRAYAGDEFKPSVSPLCDWCAYSDICPARQ